MQARLTKDANAISTELTRVTDNVLQLQERLTRGQGNPEQLTKLIDAGRARLAKLGKSATETTQKLKDLANVASPRIADAPAAAGPKPSLPAVLSGTTKTPRESEAERYLEALQKQFEKTKDLTTVEQVLADIQGKRIAGMTKALGAQALFTAKQIDASNVDKKLLEDAAEVREAMRQTTLMSIDAAFQEAEQLTAANRAFFEQTEMLGLTRESELALNKARISSLITLKEQELASTPPAPTRPAPCPQRYGTRSPR